MKGTLASTRCLPCLASRQLPNRSPRDVRVAAKEDREGRIADGLMALGRGLMGATAFSLCVAMGPQQVLPFAEANLPSGVTVKSAKALLRNALPIANKPIRMIQKNLESMDESVRIPGSTGFGQIVRSAKGALNVVSNQQQQILADVRPTEREEAAKKLDQLKTGLPELIALVDNRIKDDVLYKQQELLEYVGFVEEAMVQEFPFQIPPDYNNLPQLKGRAIVEMTIKYREKFRGDRARLVIVVDGYNAPITGGDFVDLVQKGFYDRMEIQRADGFVVQTGRPDQGEFYIDPKTNKPRLIPLEVKVAKDKEPIYEFTLEDIGRYNEDPSLPFNAYGTMALARSEFDNNSGSSQFFFLLKESELTPSGSNLLDGRYSVFGYVVDGEDALGNLKVGDVIESAKVISGGENLQAA